MRTFGIISLGCSRNLVDSEVIIGSLKRAGLKFADVEKGVDVCIVNTCAFIEPAREEAIQAILAAAALKKKGKIKYLLVCGCLPQLYKDSLLAELPEVDLVFGTSDFPKITSFLKGLSGGKQRFAVSDKLKHIYGEDDPRHLLTPGHYAYIKISEGCSNCCSYCIIPRLRGSFRSRSISSVVGEAGRLSASSALKEINLIGQDTTNFGRDTYGRLALPELLRKLCAMKTGVEWIRILYTHPAHYSDDLIAVIRGEEKICKYLDLPIQHINDRILKRMNRHTTKKEITKLIKKLKSRIPGLALRTSIIVGFPGETDKEFGELMDFVKDTRFERLGAFIYSDEEGTRASEIGPRVPDIVKSKRLDLLMKLQARISAEINKSCVGKTFEVLIDEKGSAGLFSGRTSIDAPEVDQAVSVSGDGIKVGDLTSVLITGAADYDLIGKKVCAK